MKMKICYDQGCNDIEVVKATKWHHYPILLAPVFLETGDCSSKIVHGNFLLQQPPWCSCFLNELCKSVIEIFSGEVFIVRNTIKTTQSWCLVVIGRKRSGFEMQFHLIVVWIFLKRVWKIMEIALADCQNEEFD